jgi:hypothetical protein
MHAPPSAEALWRYVVPPRLNTSINGRVWTNSAPGRGRIAIYRRDDAKLGGDVRDQDVGKAHTRDYRRWMCNPSGVQRIQ